MEPILLILLAVLGFVLVLHLIASRRKRPPRSVPARSVTPSEFSRLVGACFGDSAKARRLVEFEQRRSSGLSFDAAVLRALERLELDRGR